MSKWKCEICGLEFENFHAQGFNHKIYCPLCYYKKLYKDTELERERINKELEKYKYTADELNEIERLNNIIKEVREYTSKTQMPEGYKKMILEILNKGE